MLADADLFAEWHVRSGDVDPVYPVLAAIIGDDGLALSPDEAAELVLLYVAYYSLPSALRAWLEGWRLGTPLTDEQLRYTTGTERRGHRDVRQFRNHLDALATIVSAHGGPAAFLDPKTITPQRRWESLQRRIASVHGNGRWAGYKLGEICDTVLGLRCPPPDAGHAFSSGPRKGLADLFPETAKIAGHDPRSVAVLDGFTDTLVERWGLPVAQVETVLCDWHSMTKGAYYVGHDIDLMNTQMARELHDRSTSAVRKAGNLMARARLVSFDERWLGELQGWAGVRPALKRAYLDRKEVIWWQ